MAVVAASPAAAQADLPRTLHVVGRTAPMENADICGEYTFVGYHGESAAYQRSGTSIVIRHLPQQQRWVIDRHGFRDSTVCVAYADDLVGFKHPGHPELIWQVWEPSARQHVHDPDLAAIDAVAVLSFVGRAAGRCYHAAVGEYELAGMHHGRPRYRQRGGDHEIKYYSPEGRWLLATTGCAGNQCFGFADGAEFAHPGTAELSWTFFEPRLNNFQADQTVKSLPCPILLHIVGRCPTAENAQINGTYQAVGAIDGRPLYVQPGTRKLVRYSAKSRQWLIQCEGLEEPGLLSRLYHWAFESGAPEDRCNAFSEDIGAPHPGFCELQWQVWNTSRGTFQLDASVRSTVAPLAVEVSGRSPARENGEITGRYVLSGTHCGRPAYMRPGTTLAIRYWAPMSRWVLDLHGLRNSDCCCAYVDDLGGSSEDPTQLRPWHVFCSSRGCHVQDPGLVVLAPEDAPQSLNAPEPGAEAAASARALAAKRRLCFDDDPALAAAKRYRQMTTLGA